MQSLCGGWLWLGASQDEHQGTGTPATSSVGQASAQLFPCRPVPSPKERCCRAVYVPCTAPGMKLDKEMAAPAAAPAGRSGEGDPPREVKALAPCPGTVPAHDQLLYHLEHGARALRAHGDTGTGEEVAVIPGRGGDDDRNTQHQSSRSKRRLLVADRPPLFFPWKLSAAPACFVRYQPAVREWLLASGLAHSSVQWNWQLTKLPPYRHASKRKGEIRLDEWPARLGSRRPGRKDWTATCMCWGRRPAGVRRQAGCLDSGRPSL